jgi:hypothetical protein
LSPGALLLGHQDWGAATSYAAWFKALHLLRLYRVRGFFTYLEYDLSLSLLTVTLARNLVVRLAPKEEGDPGCDHSVPWLWVL